MQPADLCIQNMPVAYMLYNEDFTVYYQNPKLKENTTNMKMCWVTFLYGMQKRQRILHL